MKKTCQCVVALLIVCLIPLIPVSTMAAQVNLAWDANTEPDLAGYRIFIRAKDQPYNYAEPLWQGTDTSCTINAPPELEQFYLVCRAYDVYGLESENSQELYFEASAGYSLDGYTTIYNGLSGNEGLDNDLNSISVAVPAGIGDEALIDGVKNYGWAKTGLNAEKGQVVRVSFDARVLDGSENSPVFFRLEAGGIAYSAERAVFINGSWAAYQVDLVAMDSGVFDLFAYFGRLPGNYEFTRLAVAVMSPEVEPVVFVYLKGLKPSLSGNRFTAVFGFDQPLNSDSLLYCLANTQSDAENDSGFACGTLSPGVGEFNVEINASVLLYGGVNTYQGIFAKVTNTFGGQDSAPFVTAYLPGNSHDTADDGEKLFCQLAVDDVDVNYARDGYYNRTLVKYRVTEVPGPQPAGINERVDIDNNTYAGYVQDWSFARFMNTYYKRLNIWAK